MLIALPYPTMTFLPMLVAEEKGFFAAEGVRAYCVQVQTYGGQTLARLVEDGEIGFLTSLTNAMEAVLGKGQAIKFVYATTLTKFPCIARPEIRSITDLKGKKVMSGGGRSNTDLRFLCSRYGLRPGIDVEVVQGDSAGRAKAFEDPTIAAVFARSQFLHWGTKAGFQPLYYPEPGMGWYEGGLAGGVKLISQHPDLVQKVVSAVVRATAFIKNNEKEAVDVALKRIPHLDRTEAEGNYKILRAGFAGELEPSVIDYMATVVGTIKSTTTRRVTLEEVADLSFLQEAYRQLKS
jgi:ABC-type nitrate/sulfonate/bicarbonate transport system substrate-binding protein